MDTTNLVAMIRYCRPAGSKFEHQFINNFLRPLGVEQDDKGNIYKRIGDLPVLWSSHTDTVHHKSGIQSVTVHDDWILLPKGSESNCLGADDTAGVWIMSEMIKHNCPGLYVFHWGEERGGIGSKYISENPKILDGIQCAIAFDRKGFSDVITHQFGRCCSDNFGDALALKLNKSGRDFKYKSCPHGVFTDTANYIEHIPECTNLSVGYFEQHTANEYLDTIHLCDLRDVMCSTDFSDLPIIREKGESEYRHYSRYSQGGTWEQHNGYSLWKEDSLEDDYWKELEEESIRQHYNGSQRPMHDLISDHPYEIADLLESYGITHEQLIYELRQRGAIE